MKVFPIAFVGAFAVHAIAAVGVSALGSSHGASEQRAVAGQTVDIEQERAAPEVRDEEPEATSKLSTAKESSRGTPNPVHLLARAGAAAAATGDVVPDPVPTQAAPMHFKMGLASQVGTPQGAIHSPPVVAGESEVVADSDVTERARQVGGASPVYPSDARAQGVELGSPLPFEIVVDSSGRVASARALHHAGYGFDEAAMTALRTYRFTPATRAGHVVPVRMRWTVDFRLN